jgi:ectoine hydroxylase-related dioxygenase (phytanoyl-CoA dioxygenase family)
MGLLDLLRRKQNSDAVADEIASQDPDEFFGDVRVDFEAITNPRAEKFPNAGPFPWLDRSDAKGRIDARRKAGKLTRAEAKQLRFWVENGYIILKCAVEPEILDEAWAAYEAAIRDRVIELPPEPAGPNDPYPGRFQDPHMKVPALCRIMRHPTIMRWVELLLGRPPAPFQTISCHKGSQQGVHSDSIHMTTYPLGYLTAAWVAFEDIHPDSGPLVYYPGSHHWPYLFSTEVGIGETDYREYGYKAYAERYEPRVEQTLREHNVDPHYFFAKKGDALIWHANLLHGGSKRRDLKYSRRALVSHYFARGAVCYHDFSASRPKPFAGTCIVEQGKR